MEPVISKDDSSFGLVDKHFGRNLALAGGMPRTLCSICVTDQFSVSPENESPGFFFGRDKENTRAFCDLNVLYK